MQTARDAALSNLTDQLTAFVLAQRPHSISVWLSIARTQCHTDVSSEMICQPPTKPDSVSAQLNNTLNKMHLLYQKASLDAASDSGNNTGESSPSSTVKSQAAGCFSELEGILCSMLLILTMLAPVTVTEEGSLKMSNVDSTLVQCAHHLATSCLLRTSETASQQPCQDSAKLVSAVAQLTLEKIPIDVCFGHPEDSAVCDFTLDLLHGLLQLPSLQRTATDAIVRAGNFAVMLLRFHTV